MMAYSFAGLHQGKSWEDVTADAYACGLEAQSCQEIAPLPDGVGRLASVAVAARGQIYIFGGYTVAEDGTERSTPEVWRFDPRSEEYALETQIPVPVDDSVALVREDRYIYLVSGWHDTDNVDLVQVYDLVDQVWFEATRFPGAPVFGHAATLISQTRMVLCGGVKVVPAASPEARRSFVLSNTCWTGEISEQNPAEILWREIDDAPSAPRYRAAMAADPTQGSEGVLVFGGTTNPYNYDGIGYNGIPANPVQFNRTLRPVMDLRGVIRWPSNAGPDRYVFLGGMTEDQEVVDWVQVPSPD